MNNSEVSESTVLQVLNTMYSNGSESIKKEANTYLENFQKRVSCAQCYFWLWY